METIQLVLGILACLGGIPVCAALFQMFTTKVKTKRSSYTLLSAGQMLVLPYITSILLTKSSILWEFLFVLVLVSGLIAVLSRDTKEK